MSSNLVKADDRYVRSIRFVRRCLFWPGFWSRQRSPFPSSVVVLILFLNLLSVHSRSLRHVLVSANVSGTCRKACSMFSFRLGPLKLCLFALLSVRWPTEDFKKYRAKKTVNTIPFTSSLPAKDIDTVPIGNFSSKKITIVGMGQVRLTYVQNKLLRCFEQSNRQSYCVALNKATDR